MADEGRSLNKSLARIKAEAIRSTMKALHGMSARAPIRRPAMLHTKEMPTERSMMERYRRENTSAVIIGSESIDISSITPTKSKDFHTGFSIRKCIFGIIICHTIYYKRICSCTKTYDIWVSKRRSDCLSTIGVEMPRITLNIQ